ncbi:murein hydrolase activator EnvC family protein [Peribacillus loiseleuriae]|uniref:murein hydrolase activator EnvC family protein n=1 Tax=Peribacillus loiseleuriae TaxID=1679170 RepID=UPI003CFBFF09
MIYINLLFSSAIFGMVFSVSGHIFAETLEGELLQQQPPFSNEGDNLQDRKDAFFRLQNDYTTLNEQYKRIDEVISINRNNYEEMNKELKPIEADLARKQSVLQNVSVSLKNLETTSKSIQKSGNVKHYFNYLFNGEDIFIKRIVLGFSKVKEENGIVVQYKTLKENKRSLCEEITTLQKSIELLKIEMQGNLDVISQQEEEANVLKQEIESKKKNIKTFSETDSINNIKTFELEVSSSATSVGDYHFTLDDNTEIPINKGTFTPPTIGTIVSTYGYRQGSLQTGIDIANDEDIVPVLAVAEGVVSRSYFSDRDGHVIHIKHELDGESFETIYSHLDVRVVSAGDHVGKGTFLGDMGSTGIAGFKHLHFEMYKPEYGKENAVNPLLYISFQAK